MTIKAIIPQPRTTDMESSIRFYTEKLGFTLDFNYQDFYVGIVADGQTIHLKRVDHSDPSISFVDEGGHLHLYLQTDDVVAFAWANSAFPAGGIFAETMRTAFAPTKFTCSRPAPIIFAAIWLFATICLLIRRWQLNIAISKGGWQPSTPTTPTPI